MAYKKHFHPFEEHQRNKKEGKADEKGDTPEEDESTSPDQSGDEESGSVSSGKSSSNGEPESDSNMVPGLVVVANQMKQWILLTGTVLVGKLKK